MPFRNARRRSLGYVRYSRTHGPYSFGPETLVGTHSESPSEPARVAGFAVEESLALTDEMSLAWRNYIRQFADHRALDHIVKYRNTKGEPWSSRVDDILTHVLFHSAYHRGQIAVQMRASGLTPTPTDFILAVREGFIE